MRARPRKPVRARRPKCTCARARPLPRRHAGLTELAIPWNGLGGDEAALAALAGWLRGAAALRALDLRHNRLTRAGAAVLAAGLAGGPGAAGLGGTGLRLDGNLILLDGARLFWAAAAAGPGAAGAEREMSMQVRPPGPAFLSLARRRRRKGPAPGISRLCRSRRT
jgi:hypothetical protein